MHSCPATAAIRLRGQRYAANRIADANSNIFSNSYSCPDDVDISADISTNVGTNAASITRKFQSQFDERPNPGEFENPAGLVPAGNRITCFVPLYFPCIPHLPLLEANSRRVFS